MTLAIILICMAVALLLGILTGNRLRQVLLLIASVLAVYAFQPALPVRGLDFWFPSATLGLAITGWLITTPRSEKTWKGNWLSIVVIISLVVSLALTRYLGLRLPITASEPPQIFKICISLAVVTIPAILLFRRKSSGNAMLLFFLFFILLLFLVIKLPFLATYASFALRYLGHQNTSQAVATDLRWLGFSYIAFRLLHTIRDRQSGRLPPVSLMEYMIYILFFPSLAAGPIDRIERFIGDLRKQPAVSMEDRAVAGKRLAFGLAKKFILADSLGLIALNGTNATQVHSTGWAWVLLYAFTFQIFFDFSGYTDIAIGLGRLMGIHLPENFNRPYLKPNLTQFWSNWHMTLTQWFRAYFFNPITRALRSVRKPLSIPVIIFITQMATMILIGMWHGVTINFALWGAWHGLGLFFHNRWSELTRVKFASLSNQAQKILNLGGTLLTFNYVALGWIFFALPEPGMSFEYLRLLFGGG